MSILDVWLVPVVAGSAGDPALTELLGPGDWDAIKSLGFAADRDRAVTARAAARQKLGSRLGMHPRSVPLVPRGRPIVGGADLNVSWSHSGAWVALAVAAGRRVGIDIEKRPQRVPLRALAQIGLRSLEEFVDFEAAGKASGRGLAGPQPQDQVTVRRLSAPLGYVAAIAAQGRDWSIELHVSV